MLTRARATPNTLPNRPTTGVDGHVSNGGRAPGGWGSRVRVGPAPQPHLLLGTGEVPLARLMRAVLTGYAGVFKPP